MKALFAIKNLSDSVGGAERVFCTICSLLADRGHEIIVLTFDDSGSKSFYPLSHLVRRIDLGIGNSASRAGLKDSLRRISAVRTHIRHEQPRIVVGFMHSMFVPLAAAIWGMGIPLIGSEHIVPAHYQSRPLQFLLLQIAARRTRAMTVLSDSVRSLYPLSMQERMAIMPNPVISGTARNLDHNQNSHGCILNVGRLDPQKDQSTLIKAFCRIAPLAPNWNLKIIGEGALRPELDKLIHSSGLIDRIHLSGITSDIGSEYASADMFVMSSRYESFGLVTAEAMAHGLPVIGYRDCPGTNELIQDQHTGILIDGSSDRIKSLADSMLSLIHNSQQRNQLGDPHVAILASTSLLIQYAIVGND